MTVRVLRFLTLLLCALPAFAAAQFHPYFARTLDVLGNADYGVRVAKLSDGNLVVAGRMFNSTTNKWGMWIQRYNSLGESLGAPLTRGDSEASFYLKDMVVDPQDNIYAVAEHYTNFSSGDQDILITRWNADGTHAWTKFYNGAANQDDRVWDLEYDGFGHVAFAGETELAGGTDYSGLLQIYNVADGSSFMDKVVTFPGTSRIRLFKVQVFGDSDYYVAGESDNSIFVKKYGPTGADGYGILYSGGGSAGFGDFIVRDTGIYVAGSFTSQVAGGSDFQVWKFAIGNGDFQWNRNWNGQPEWFGKAWSLATDTEGNIVAGGTQAQSGSGNFGLVKYDPLGNRLWTASFATNGNDVIRKVLLGSDNKVYTTGEIIQTATARDLWSAVWSADGTSIAPAKRGGESYYEDAMLVGHNLHVAGWYDTGGTNEKENSVFIKYYRGLQQAGLLSTTIAGGRDAIPFGRLWDPAATGTSIQISEDSSLLNVIEAPQIVVGDSYDEGVIETFPVSATTVIPVTLSLVHENGTQSVTVNLTLTPPVLQAFTVNPTTIYGGSTAIGTVTLNVRTPAGGKNVGITSNTSVLTFPGTVNVPKDSSSELFNITLGQVTALANRTMTATMDGVSKTVALVLRPGLKSFTLNPTSVTGGDPTQATATIGGPSPSGGTTINLTDNSGSITSPATAAIGSGGTGVFVKIDTLQVGATATRTVTATLGSVSMSASLTLTAGPRLQSLVLNPATVEGGASCTATATLTGVAPTGGRVVQVSDNSSAILTPASVTVPSGAASVNFTVGTATVTSSATRQVTAVQGGVARTANLTITPTRNLTSLSVSPSTVTGGQNTTGTVTLSGTAPAGGKVVALSDNSTVLTTPPSVTVAAGATSANFTIGTTTVSASATRQVTATLNGVSKTANVTVNPATQQPVVVQMVNSSFSPQTVTVAPGQIVRFSYVSGFSHTATRDVTTVPGPNSPVMSSPGETYDFTVPVSVAKGTNIYSHCGFHGSAGNGSSPGVGMVGVIQVR